MNIRFHSPHLSVPAFFSSAILLSALVCAAPPDGKGKPPKDDPPSEDLPAIRYSIDVAPIPASATFHSWGTRDMNNPGMVVGNFSDPAQHGAFLFSSSSGAFYDFGAEAILTSKLDALVSGFYFRTAYAINDVGVVTGLLYNPEIDVARGYVIDTVLSSDVEDWVLYLIPDVGGYRSYGVDINLWGEVAGYYERPDQTRDRFVYTPFADPPQPVITFGLSSTSLDPFANINDQSQLAQYFYTTGPIEVYDATAGSPALNTFDLGRISDGISFNNDGFVVAIKRDQKLGGKGKSYDILVKIDSATGSSENVLTSRPYTLYAEGHHFLNNNGDVAVQNGGNSSTGRIELVHAGFSPDSEQNVWNVDDLIADGDPWKADWIASHGVGLGVSAIGDRSDQNDASGYPVMAGTFFTADGDIKCAVLTPQDLP